MDVDGGGERRRGKERAERHGREERDHHRDRSGSRRHKDSDSNHGHREPDRNHGHGHGQLTGAKVVHCLGKVMEGEDALVMNLKNHGDADAEEGDARHNNIVITEMEEFVLGLQLNEETRKPEAEVVFMDEDDDATSPGTLAKDGTYGLAVIKEEAETEDPVKPVEVVHEAAVGKGLAGALKFLQVRGTLNEGTYLGGGTTDKKKSKLVGIEDGPKEIRIERTDEFGRVMTPKEAFRDLSHKFHGKRPGKMKQEKRQRKYQDELKTKRMKSSDTPLMSAEKMRVAQAHSKTPYLVLSGNAQSRQRLYGRLLLTRDVSALHLQLKWLANFCDVL